MAVWLAWARGLGAWRRVAAEERERGATMVEYALLVAMIALVCIVALRFLGSQASNAFSSLSGSLGQ